jgi:hypothetical protein
MRFSACRYVERMRQFDRLKRRSHRCGKSTSRIRLCTIHPTFIAGPCFRTGFRCTHSLGINKLEMNAVKKLQTLGMGAVVATAAFGLFALTANAQQPPAGAPTAPAVAPVKPSTPAAPPAAAKAPTTPAPAAAKAPATAAAKKPAVVVCKGLDETGCKSNPDCSYVVPTKADAKTGKVDKSYCRKTAGVAVKKPAAAAAPAATTPAKPAAAATPAKPAAPAAAAAVKPNAPAPATKQ